MLSGHPSILTKEAFLSAQGPIECVEVVPERVPGRGFTSPFEKSPNYRGDWWNDVPYEYARGGMELLSFRDSGGEVARARVLLNPTLTPGYGVPRIAAGYVSLWFFEVDIRLRCTDARFGARAVDALLARYPHHGVLAYSQGADGFWDAIGWRRFEHADVTSDFAPLYVWNPVMR